MQAVNRMTHDRTDTDIDIDRLSLISLSRSRQRLWLNMFTYIDVNFIFKKKINKRESEQVEAKKNDIKLIERKRNGEMANRVTR